MQNQPLPTTGLTWAPDFANLNLAKNLFTLPGSGLLSLNIKIYYHSMATDKQNGAQIDTRQFMLEIAGAMLDLVEEIDPLLRKHSERVADNSANFCQELNLVGEEELDIIYVAGLLHDVGLVTLPTEIWQKPISDGSAEASQLMEHPEIGARILSNLSCLTPLLPLIRHHHEAKDGSGYPDGLKGSDVPFGAQILSLANYFDNLAFPRATGQQTPVNEVLKKFEDSAKARFAEELVSNFITFVESNSLDSGSYIQKKETIYIRMAFTQILQKFMAGELKPPVVPRVVREIQSVFKGDPSDVREDEVADIIEKDPVISLRLISIANSPAYRGFSEIRNVRAAIPRLGLKETLNLVIAVSQKSLYQTDKTHFKLLMDQLWVHSLATAYGAKLFAQKINFDDPENLFLLGLTHDIGKIFLLKAFTDTLEVKSFHMDAIRANLQGGHIGISSKLLKRWGFDDEFIRILTHKDSSEYGDNTDPQILILHLANLLTRKIGFSLTTGEIEMSAVESARYLKLDNATIDQVGNEIQKIIHNVAHLF